MYKGELIDRALLAVKESIDFSVTLLGRNGVVVEGHRGLRRYSDTEVILKVSNYYISIYGSNLTISEISDVDIFIIGKIEGVRYE